MSFLSTAASMLSKSGGDSTEQVIDGPTIDKRQIINGVNGDPRQLGFLIHHAKKPTLNGGAGLKVRSPMSLSSGSGGGGMQSSGVSSVSVLVVGALIFFAIIQFL